MADDLNKMKRNRLHSIRGQETINQVEHVTDAGAKLMMGGVLVAGDVITDDVSAAGVKVYSGSICRIEVSATTYVAFGADPSMGAVSVTTTPALKLSTAGVYLVVATDDFIRASAAFTRMEVISLLLGVQQP